MLQPDFIYKSLLEQELVSHDEAIARELAGWCWSLAVMPD